MPKTNVKTTTHTVFTHKEILQALSNMLPAELTDGCEVSMGHYQYDSSKGGISITVTTTKETVVDSNAKIGLGHG